MKARRKIVTLLAIVTAIIVIVPAAIAAGGTTLADFEGGAPGGWFVFSGASTVSTTTQVVADADALARPNQVGDNEILNVTFNVTDYGGFGQSFVDLGATQDWSNYESFNFWFYGTGSGLSYQAEISDNRSDPNSDTSERFDYTFTDNAVGWQFISIPFADFTRATDFQPAGAPDDGFTLTEIYAWAIVLPIGTDTVYMDDLFLGHTLVDDFEGGVPTGTDGDGIAIGFTTFNDPGSSVAISTTNTPPAPVPDSVAGNNVLQVDTDVNDSSGYAGVVHAFSNGAVDTWVPQDWSTFEGLSFWLYGNNTGQTLFIDILDNRNPGSTTDDAERYSIDLVDDFSGWQFFEIPFANFNRKEVGNGAPNDGFTLTEVHGWAFGVFNAGVPFSNYMDNVGLYGIADIPDLTVSYATNTYAVDEGNTAVINVKLNRELGIDDEDPAEVSINYATESGSAVADRDYTPAMGTLTFTQGGPTEQTFNVPTFDNPKNDGSKTVILRLSDPVAVATGFVTQAVLSINDDEAYDPNLLDDFERGTYLWNTTGPVGLSTPEIADGDPMALPGQGAYEHILKVAAPADGPTLIVQKEDLLAQLNSLVPSGNDTVDKHVNRAIDRIERSLNANYWENGFYLDAKLGHHVFLRDKQAVKELERAIWKGSEDAAELQAIIEALAATDRQLAQIALAQAVANHGDQRYVGKAGDNLDKAAHELAKGDYYDAIYYYYQAWRYAEKAVAGLDLMPTTINRDFALGQNWSKAEALTFWFYGTGSGDEIGVNLKNNRAPDPGADGWSLAWSDEFNDPAGTPPNPDFWTHEIGDGAYVNNTGWGNQELQYYTDSTDNSATDGNGNLVITAKAAENGEQCYYGDCEYTSARLISQYKAEFAYGRIESRLQVPQGAGLWPAFWSLGTDIPEVGWPQTGEIDIMEFVGRLPNEIFGTIHGPGYAGGQSFGNIYDFGTPVYDQFHTFTVEWEPDSIKWYVDGILYHTAVPGDVAPNEWVYNHPFFLIFNVAVGGNFGGAVGPDTTFPQSMVVDYVRVYQGPDTAERFSTSFSDDFVGWQQVEIPFTDFVRSGQQPAGAPDDGLNLNEVWGYGFELPAGGVSNGNLFLDQVRLKPVPPPTAIVVQNANNSGEGSLRQALEDIADAGTITFDPALAGQTIALTSGPLTLSRDITIDGSDAPGLAINGNGVHRVFEVGAGVTANVSNLILTNGYGYQLGGGVINNGNLTLDHVTLTGNTMTTDAGDFWQGGGAIYNGEFATLNLIDSTVDNNHADWSGGGIYSFFNTTTNIIRSTISNNVSGDVGGGLRLLGNGTIENSTISGNEATGWYGGALFLTDGVVDMNHTTVVNNTSPFGIGAPAAVFVGTFGPGSAFLNVGNSIIADNTTEGCFLAPWGAGAVGINSLGNNLFSDSTCFNVAADIVSAATGLDALADNGGATQTHALLAGSPALDAANGGSCLATDQRGVARPQGAACDIGAYEAE